MDRDGSTYFFDVHFTMKGDTEWRMKTDRQTGVAKLQENVGDLIERYNPGKIKVTLYKNKSNAKAQRESGKLDETIILVNDNTNSPVIIDNRKPDLKQETVPQMQGLAGLDGLGFAGLNGLDGLNKYFEMKQESLMGLIQMKTIESEKTTLQKEFDKLKEEYSKLKSDYEELATENDELSDQVTELEKFKPSNFKIGKFDGVTLLGEIGQRAITGILKRNTTGAARILGISPSDLQGFLNGGDDDNDNNEDTRQISQANNNVDFEEVNENLSEEEKQLVEGAKQISAWFRDQEFEIANKFYSFWQMVAADNSLLSKVLKVKIPVKPQTDGAV
jgi:hypothetical protein